MACAPGTHTTMTTGVLIAHTAAGTLAGQIVLQRRCVIHRVTAVAFDSTTGARVFTGDVSVQAQSVELCGGGTPVACLGPDRQDRQAGEGPPIVVDPCTAIVQSTVTFASTVAVTIEYSWA